MLTALSRVNFCYWLCIFGTLTVTPSPSKANRNTSVGHATFRQIIRFRLADFQLIDWHQSFFLLPRSISPPPFFPLILFPTQTHTHTRTQANVNFRLSFTAFCTVQAEHLFHPANAYQLDVTTDESVIAKHWPVQCYSDSIDLAHSVCSVPKKCVFVFHYKLFKYFFASCYSCGAIRLPLVAPSGASFVLGWK